MPLTLEDINPPRIEIFQRADDLYDWRLVAGNGETVCGSSQGFRDRTDAARAVERAGDLFTEDIELRFVG